MLYIYIYVYVHRLAILPSPRRAVSARNNVFEGVARVSPGFKIYTPKIYTLVIRNRSRGEEGEKEEEEEKKKETKKKKQEYTRIHHG